MRPDWLLLLACLFTTCRQAPDAPATLTKLPIRLKEGFGPFHAGFSPLGSDKESGLFWHKTYPPTKGVPRHWTGVSKSRIWLNTHQFIYQNFLAGNINSEGYKYLQQSWHWTPDTTKLSRTPIRCYVCTIRGFDEKRGKWAVMVDTNNNLDFSDESAVYPEPVDNQNPYAYKHPRLVHYEVYQRGKIIASQLPMVIKTIGSEFVYTFPQYAVASFQRGEKNYELLISSGFTRPDYEISTLTPASGLSESAKVDLQKVVNIDEVIDLGGIRYTNKGVDVFTGLLTLEPVSTTDKIYSLQVGHPVKPFIDREFTTGRPVSLAQQQGKYVFIDFWGTWCKGCVAEMPALNNLYQQLDTSRFAFIGIVADSPERLRKFVDDKKVTWPQVLSTDGNKLAETYHITGFPTSVLIDPDGLVVARDLRSDELRRTLQKLGN